MNLRDTILAQHSKANCTKIVQWIGNNQERFNTLFDLFLSDDDWCVAQKASWPLSYAVQMHPELIKPHFGKLLKNLKKPKLHDAVKRNTVRLLQDITVPERFRGALMDTCFGYISSPVEKPAIKAFSLTILHNLSAHYPDIKLELKTIIEDRWEYETAAFKSRARKILKELS